MKFRKNGKKQKEEQSCLRCGPGMSPESIGRMSNKEAMKKLKELEKKRAKPADCPYINDCDFKMLPEIGRIICLDQEVGGRQSQTYMAHMAGQHMWMSCRKFAERKREDEGVLPRNLKKALKAKEK